MTKNETEHPGLSRPTPGVMIAPLVPPVGRREEMTLCELLIACVGGGASIGFLAPLPPEEAQAYWTKIFAELPGGGRLLWVARGADGGIVGAAQLACETKANGRHRGEVQKVMVHPRWRRRGIAAQLLAEIEREATARGLTLLFLDTSDSHAGARELYEATGYTYAGGIPGYALNPAGVPEKNAIFYKTLAPRG